VPVPRVLFVATDDFAAVVQLRELLGAGFEVVTLTDKSAKGHLEYEYNRRSDEARFREVELLWADMELLAAAELFDGNQKSNIWRIVHQMRVDKPAHSTISVHTMANATSTCCVSPVNTRTDWVSHVGSCVADCTA
jgi:N12 class adenine-specific DNA methylase